MTNFFKKSKKRTDGRTNQRMDRQTDTDGQTGNDDFIGTSI